MYIYSSLVYNAERHELLFSCNNSIYSCSHLHETPLKIISGKDKVVPLIQHKEEITDVNVFMLIYIYITLYIVSIY